MRFLEGFCTRQKQYTLTGLTLASVVGMASGVHVFVWSEALPSQTELLHTYLACFEADERIYE